MVKVSNHGAFSYTPADVAHPYFGWDWFTVDVKAGNNPTVTRTIQLDLRDYPHVHNAEPNMATGTAPAEAPDGWDGVVAAYEAAKTALGTVLQDVGNLGFLTKSFKDLGAAATADEADDYIRQAGVVQDLSQAHFVTYSGLRDAAFANMGEYLRTWSATASLEVSTHIPDMNGKLNGLPVDVAGIHADKDLLTKYGAALATYGAGAGVLASHAGTVYTIAVETHDALNDFIRGAGVASIIETGAELLAERGCAAFAKYAAQQLVNTAVGIGFGYVSGVAAELAQSLGVPPEYIRIGADAMQVVFLVRAAQSERSKLNSGCFVAGTKVLLGDDSTEEDFEDIHVGQRVATDGGVANSADGKTKADDPNGTAVDYRCTTGVPSARHWESFGTFDAATLSHDGYVGGTSQNDTYQFRVRALAGTSYTSPETLAGSIRSGATMAYFTPVSTPDATPTDVAATFDAPDVTTGRVTMHGTFTAAASQPSKAFEAYAVDGGNDDVSGNMSDSITEDGTTPGLYHIDKTFFPEAAQQIQQVWVRNGTSAFATGDTDTPAPAGAIPATVSVVYDNSVTRVTWTGLASRATHYLVGNFISDSFHSLATVGAIGRTTDFPTDVLPIDLPSIPTVFIQAENDGGKSTTQPATTQATDEPIVQSIGVNVTQNNGENAYCVSFQDAVTVKGQNLDQVEIRQLIRSRTGCHDWNGQNMTLNQIMNEVNADPVARPKARTSASSAAPSARSTPRPARRRGGNARGKEPTDRIPDVNLHLERPAAGGSCTKRTSIA